MTTLDSAHVGRIILSSFIMAIFVGAGRADVLVCPYPYAVSSENGKFIFIMSPACEKNCDRNDGYGVAYEIGPGDQSRPLWRTSGWYTFETYISCDGKYLVRIDDVMHDDVSIALRDETLWDRMTAAISFYDEGKLLSSHSVFDLDIDTASSLQMIVWRDRGSKYGFKPECSYLFEIIAVDGTALTFDVRTGALVTTEVGKVKTWRSQVGKMKEPRKGEVGRSLWTAILKRLFPFLD